MSEFLPKKMPAWQLQIAKAQLSQLVKNATIQSQVITIRGENAVVVLSIHEFIRLTQPIINFWQFMQQSPLKDTDLDITRLNSSLRDIDEL
jgi:antitoxin Phd